MNLIYRINLLMVSFLFVAMLSACSQEEKENPAYFKEFTNIKTNQFMWNYGQGGIYWVLDNAIVLDAQVKNSEGIFERGLYQVNVNDGSYIKLVEVGENKLYSYCFVEKVLYVKSDETLNILYKPKLYSIKLETEFKKHKDGRYSPLLCESVEVPSMGGYIPLMEGDGFLKIDWDGPRLPDKGTFQGVLKPDNPVTMIDNNWKHLRTLDLTIAQVSTPQFIEYLNTYFGFRVEPMRANCFILWWLNRDEWRADTKNICLGSWASQNSKFLLPTKVGIYVQHYTSNKYKTYLVADGFEYPIEKVSARGSTLSADGCRVAYGSGEIGYGKSRFSQQLKIFDACEFIK